MLYTALIIIDVVLALALIGLILIQHGKGADAGAAFGSGSAGTVFGASGGGSVLTKITTWLAVAFFAVTLGLSILAKDRVQTAVTQAKKETSIVQEKIPEDAVQAPVITGNDSPFVPVPSGEGGVENIPVEAAPVSPAPVEGVPSMDDIPAGPPANAQ